MAHKREERFLNIKTSELRAAKMQPASPADPNEPAEPQLTLTGYAAVFDQGADIGGMWVEYVRKGAFDKTLQEADVRCLYNHDTNIVLGRNTAGTLRLKTDKTGLYFECDLPDTGAAESLWESINRGDVTQCSFGFRTIKDRWYQEEIAGTDSAGKPIKIMRDARELLEVQLFDVSPVTYAAYDGTSVSARDALGITEINAETLNYIIIRSKKGLEMTTEQRKQITETIETLSKYLKSEPETHSEPAIEPVNTTLLRSKLDIIEREIY